MNEQAKQVTERQRIYTFPGGDVVVLNNVTEIRVSDSGNHRIKADGKLHIVPTGWIHILIDEPEWTF